MKKLLALFLALLTLSTTALAYDPPAEFTDLDTAMADFMAEFGLNEENFAVSYYNTVTGESYAFNDGKFMVAASTFKLPLNMYYYEMERDGEIASDAYIPRADTTLSDAHYNSLVWSDNEDSLGMLYNLGDFPTYKEKMRKYFTMADDEIDYIYFHDNYYCTRMMLDALKYLYDNSGDFEEMLGYMKEAQPGEYFKAGTDYEVAHKYGYFEGAVNDVGIIYAPQPFLLAVYTQDIEALGICSKTAKLLAAYTDWQTPAEEPVEETSPEEPAVELPVEEIPTETEPEPIPVEDETEETAPMPEPEPVPEPVPQEPDAFEWWMVAVALGVFLVGGFAVILLFNTRKMGKYEKRYKERMKK